MDEKLAQTDKNCGIGGSTVTPLTENILPECKTVFPVTLDSIRVNSRIHRSLWLSVT